MQHHKLFIACAILEVAAPAHAQRRVPQDFPTIQAAINAGGTDPVVVAAGTYNENLLVTNAVTIRGAGASATIIDASGINPGATSVINTANVALTLEDLTITGGDAGFLAAGGVTMNSGGTLNVRRCIFHDNTGDFGGIFATAGAQVTIADSLFTNNAGTFIAGAIQADNNASVTANNCTFSGNSSASASVAGSSAGSSIAINNCIVWANQSPGVFSQAVGSPISQTNSIVQAGLLGGIDADPLFADAPGGDYSLGPGSPAIDAGDNALVQFESMLDLARNLRKTDNAATPDTGTGTPPIVDLGAYEAPADLGTQRCPADYNSDGSFAVGDILDFLADWSSECN